VHDPDGKGWTRSWNLVILLLILITLKQTTACLLHMFQIISHFAKKKIIPNYKLFYNINKRLIFLFLSYTLLFIIFSSFNY
jgi:hypothetical protein